MNELIRYLAHNDVALAVAATASVMSLLFVVCPALWRLSRLLIEVLTTGWNKTNRRIRRSIAYNAHVASRNPVFFMAAFADDILRFLASSFAGIPLVIVMFMDIMNHKNVFGSIIADKAVLFAIILFGLFVPIGTVLFNRIPFYIRVRKLAYREYCKTRVSIEK